MSECKIERTQLMNSGIKEPESRETNSVTTELGSGGGSGTKEVEGIQITEIGEW